jgi:hypothetical protein
MKKILLSMTILFGGYSSMIGQCGADVFNVTTSHTEFVCEDEVIIGLDGSSEWAYYTMVYNNDTIMFQNGLASGGPIQFNPLVIKSQATIEVLSNTWINPDALYYSEWGAQYVQNGNNSINEVFTIQTWINYGNHNPGQYYPIISFQGNTPSLGLLNGELLLQIGGTVVLQTIGNSIAEWDWVNVAATFDGSSGEVKLYINGTEVESGTVSSTTFSQSGLRIGADWNITPNIFDGMIDNVHIFDVVLPQQTITDYMEECLNENTPDITALYKFTEGQGVFTEDLVSGTQASVNMALGANPADSWMMGYWGTCGYQCSQPMGNPLVIDIVPIPTENFTATQNTFCESGNITTIASNNSYNGASYFLINSATNDTIDGPVLSSGGGISFNTGTINQTTDYHVEAAIIRPETGIYVHGATLTPGGEMDINFTDFTVETWFKNDGSAIYSEDVNIIGVFDFDNINDIPLSIVAIEVDYNTGEAYIRPHNFFSIDPQPSFSTTGSTSILDGEWHHVALRYSAGSNNYEMIINANFEATLASPFTSYPWFGAVVAAFDIDYVEAVGDVTGSVHGTFDDIRFWEVSRTNAEITATMDGCIPGDLPNLAGNWKLDEGSGDNFYNNVVNSTMSKMQVTGDEGDDFTWTDGVYPCALCAEEVSQVITIEVGDTEAPEVVCENYSLELNAVGAGTIQLADLGVFVTDNCDNNPVITMSQSSFNCADVSSPVSVIVEAEDESGNIGTCNALVTVIDNIAPTVSNVPADIVINVNTSNCSAEVTWTVPTFTDNCAVASVTSSHNPGDVFTVGTHVVSYTGFDAAGNSTPATFAVTVNQDLSLDTEATEPLCFGDETAGIESTVSGNGSPFTYSWDNGATTANLENVAAGTYVLTVTDAFDCTEEATVVIGQPDELEIETAALSNPTDCNTPTGSINLTVSGGVTDYNYAWTGGAAGSNPTGLAAGIYAVTVTDDNGCTTAATYTLNDPDAPQTTLNAGQSNIELACSYDEDGTITVDISLQGSATSATYDWNNGDFTTQNLTDLPSGVYNLLVTDNNDCSSSLSVTVTAPDEIEIDIIALDNLLCFEDESGAISIAVTGGTPDFAFNWNDGDYTIQNLSNLSAGEYDLTVTDDNGCEATLQAEITQPDELTASATMSPITLGNDGEIEVATDGGTGDLTFSWEGPNGFESTDQNLSGLNDVGEYELTVTDENDCSYTLTIMLESIVATADHTKDSFSVYPNPSVGVFYVATTVDQGSIAVHDALGRLVLTRSISSNETTVDLSDLQRGVYLFEIQLKNHKHTARVVLK